MSFKKVIALCLAATAVFGCAACADAAPANVRKRLTTPADGDKS